MVEGSPNINSNAGSFYLLSGNSGGAQWSSLGRGTILAGGAIAKIITAPAPDLAVITTTSDIAGDMNTIRRNGIPGVNGAADLGGGDFLAYPIYIGRRAGTSLPFNGHLYGLILRFGPTLTDAQIATAEKWMAAKTGVTL